MRKSQKKVLAAAVKSVGADDHIPPLIALQQAAKAQNVLIVPVFAQYGKQEELNQRIAGFNAAINTTDSTLPPVTDLGVDWGDDFQGQIATLQVAQRDYGAVVTGNGGTLIHFALAAAQEVVITILCPPWQDMPGEGDWDAVMRHNYFTTETKRSFTIVDALQPRGHRYEAVMELTERDTGAAAILIHNASRNACHRNYPQICKMLGLPEIPGGGYTLINPNTLSLG